MKTIKFILLSSLAMIIFSGCSKDEESIENSMRPTDCNLRVQITDKSGNDKVKGLAYSEERLEVLFGECMWYMVKSDNSEEYKRLRLNLGTEYQSLFFWTYTITPDHTTKMDPEVTHKLSCSRIFGNPDLHTIVAYWEKSKTRGIICTKVTFDGKEVPVTKNQHGYQPVAHITLDN